MDYPLTGEPLALDLANTVVRERGRTVDLVADASAGRAWLAVHADRLPAGRRPPHAHLIALRDALREALAAAAERRPADPSALAQVDAAAALAAPSLLGSRTGPRSELRAVDSRPGATTLAAIARSAHALLEPGGHELRRCAGHDCLLHFLATDARRRYCSTATCGNRARQARHRQRVHEAADTPREQA